MKVIITVYQGLVESVESDGDAEFVVIEEGFDFRNKKKQTVLISGVATQRTADFEKRYEEARKQIENPT